MDSRFLTGAVDMLILDVLSRGDSYGYQISQTVMSQSDGYFELKEGSLYPALHRLERQKMLKAYWVEPEEGRRRKYYKLTAKGRKTLEERRENWRNFSQAVNGVLGGQHRVLA
ncbi:MAG: PadR family transcriptional regulator [Phycisphaerales bacterium]|nr:MAG: PadR family transcriptional regulator [Phycisphaerales bacterium]